MELSSNPHPVRRLGAILAIERVRQLEFQSSPSPKTGRYAPKRLAINIALVPILTQSEDWALCGGSSVLCCSLEVPILTQSEDWALFLKFGQSPG